MCVDYADCVAIRNTGQCCHAYRREANGPFSYCGVRLVFRGDGQEREFSLIRNLVEK